ncbi:MAG: hypothetical protein QXF87_08635 [Thermofilaceae archaeon]
MRLELALALALALALTPTLFLDDLANPDPTNLNVRGGASIGGVSMPLLEHEELALLHVNDTLTVEVKVHGCELLNYTLRVTHVHTGRSYEYRGNARTPFPVFTTELGGVYRVQLALALETDRPCAVDILIYYTRGEKPGYGRLYRLELLAGSAVLAVVGAYGVRKVREVS